MTTAPVLDDDVLHRLGEQLGNPEALCSFLRRYLSLMDRRIARLEQALIALDQACWMDAVLSLQTSSAMAGARALAEQVADLQRYSARCPSWGEPAGPVGTRRSECMAHLRQLATETACQVQPFLRRAGSAADPG